MALSEEDKAQVRYFLYAKEREIPDWFNPKTPPVGDPDHGTYSWAIHMRAQGYMDALQDILRTLA